MNPGNNTCVGTWNITFDVSTGNYFFSGPSGNLVIFTSPAETCTITFTMGASQMPAGFTTTAGITMNAGALISATDLSTGQALGPIPESGASPTTIESCGASLDKQVSWATVASPGRMSLVQMIQRVF